MKCCNRLISKTRIEHAIFLEVCMKGTSFLRLYLAIFMILIALLTACQKIPSDSQALAPVQEQKALETPAVLMNGSCVYLEGTVTLLRAGNERIIEIGDEVIAGDTIKTANNALCELQFGSTAKLQLQADTVLEVTDIFLSDVSRRVAAKLEIGSILNKVQKLSGSDSYTVRTGSTVCGVRGTEFVVKVDSSFNTVIAVKKGKVAALPATPVLEQIITESSTNAVASAALETLVANTPIIEENQELLIDKTVVAEAEVVHTAMQKAIASVPPIPMEKEEEAPVIAPVITYEAPQIINNVPVKPTDKPKPAFTEQPEALSAIQKVVQTVQAAAQKPVVKPKQVSNQFKNTFKQLDSIQLPQPGATQGDGTTSSGMQDSSVPQTTSAAAENAAAGQAEQSDKQGVAQSSQVANQPVQTPAPKPESGYKVIPALKRAVSGNIVRSLSGNAFIVSDKNGTVTAISNKGQRLWVVTTQNKGTERTYAVPFKDFIYFSGSDELVIIDAKTGQVMNRIALDSNTSHLLGNRVVPFPNAVVFPTKTGIDVLAPTTGEIIRSIEIPSGSMMTPANYNGKAVIVNQKGTLYIVNIDTGNIEKEIKTPAIQPTAQSPKILKSLVCFADRKGLLVQVDLSSGTVNWTKQLEGSTGIFTDLEFAQEGIFAFGNDTIYAYALDGNELFAPLNDAAAPPSLIRGVLVYASKNKEIKTIDVRTGAIIATVQINDIGTARPLFFNGFVYVGLSSGSVIQIPAEKLNIKK